MAETVEIIGRGRGRDRRAAATVLSSGCWRRLIDIDHKHAKGQTVPGPKGRQAISCFLHWRRPQAFQRLKVLCNFNLEVASAIMNSSNRSIKLAANFADDGKLVEGHAPGHNDVAALLRERKRDALPYPRAAACHNRSAAREAALRLSRGGGAGRGRRCAGARCQRQWRTHVACQYLQTPRRHAAFCRVWRGGWEPRVHCRPGAGRSSQLAHCQLQCRRAQSLPVSSRARTRARVRGSLRVVKARTRAHARARKLQLQ